MSENAKNVKQCKRNCQKMLKNGGLSENVEGCLTKLKGNVAIC